MPRCRVGIDVMGVGVVAAIVFMVPDVPRGSESGGDFIKVVAASQS